VVDKCTLAYFRRHARRHAARSALPHDKAAHAQQRWMRQDWRVDFVAVDFPQANRLTVHILAAGAEHERAMIAARTKAALAAAKARGRKLGEDRATSPPRAPSATLQAKPLGSYQLTGRPRTAHYHPRACRGRWLPSQIAAILTNRGITTPSGRGSRWTATQASRVMERAA
jgi:hypothetical protein